MYTFICESKSKETLWLCVLELMQICFCRCDVALFFVTGCQLNAPTNHRHNLRDRLAGEGQMEFF